MRISNLWSAVCAAAFLAGYFTVRAQDTPAQAAARAALMEKMSELNSQPGSPTNQMMAPAVVVTPSGAVAAQPNPPANKPMPTATPPPVEMQAAPAPTPPETPPATAVANDTPAQAAARAALATKMGELNAQQVQPANPNLAPIVVAPSGAVAGVEQPLQPTNAMTASPPPVETQPVPSPTPPETSPVPASATDTPAQAAARAALLEKMNELNAPQTQPVQSAAQASQPTNAMTVSPPPAAAAPAQTTQPVTAPVPSAGNSGLFTPAPPPSNPGVQINVPPAVSSAPPMSNQSQTNQQPVALPPGVVAAPPAKPATPVVAPAVKSSPPANLNYAGKSLGFKPIEAPPPPVSAQKEAELQALLARYMANQISPDEYQKERAAILAEP